MLTPISKLNTFVSQRLVFEEKNESCLFENASNLTHDFCMTILTRKFNKIFKESFLIFFIKKNENNTECIKQLYLLLFLIIYRQNEISKINFFGIYSPLKT